jgi:hypothetical protein
MLKLNKILYTDPVNVVITFQSSSFTWIRSELCDYDSIKQYDGLLSDRKVFDHHLIWDKFDKNRDDENDNELTLVVNKFYVNGKADTVISYLTRLSRNTQESRHLICNSEMIMRLRYRLTSLVTLLFVTLITLMRKINSSNFFIAACLWISALSYINLFNVEITLEWTINKFLKSYVAYIFSSLTWRNSARYENWITKWDWIAIQWSM